MVFLGKSKPNHAIRLSSSHNLSIGFRDMILNYSHRCRNVYIRPSSDRRSGELGRVKAQATVIAAGRTEPNAPYSARLEPDKYEDPPSRREVRQGIPVERFFCRNDMELPFSMRCIPPTTCHQNPTADREYHQ
jgi:hypothetical protein